MSDTASNEAAPVVSIVMLVKNEHPHLSRSLPVVLDQDIPASYDVTVIDSGSTDGSVELVRQLSAKDRRLRLVEIPPGDFHHARTRNLGAELASGRYLVYLGGDAVPRSAAWLGLLVGPVIGDRAGDVAASYGRQVARPGASITNVCRMAYNYGPTPMRKQRGASSSAKELYFFSSVNCCIDRTALDPPIFDASFPVDEDVTASRRLIDSGRTILYIPEAVTEHSHDYSYGQILRRYFDNVVVYRRLGIFGGQDGDVSLSDGSRFLSVARSELKGRGPSDYARFGAFFFVAGVGVLLGRMEHRLPRALRSRLSVYGVTDHRHSDPESP